MSKEHTSSLEPSKANSSPRFLKCSFSCLIHWQITVLIPQSLWNYQCMRTFNNWTQKVKFPSARSLSKSQSSGLPGRCLSQGRFIGNWNWAEIWVFTWVHSPYILWEPLPSLWTKHLAVPPVTEEGKVESLGLSMGISGFPCLNQKVLHFLGSSFAFHIIRVTSDREALNPTLHGLS